MERIENPTTEDHPFGSEVKNIVEISTNNVNPMFCFIGGIGRGSTNYLHVRKTYVDRRSGDWKAGKGLTIAYEPDLWLEVINSMLDVINTEIGTNYSIEEK